MGLVSIIQFLLFNFIYPILVLYFKKSLKNDSEKSDGNIIELDESDILDWEFEKVVIIN